MNRWKITFIFLTGFMLREVLGHIWLSADGMLPLTSRMFGLTITPDMNMIFILLNIVLLLVCAYLAFFFDWASPTSRERHA